MSDWMGGICLMRWNGERNRGTERDTWRKMNQDGSRIT